MSYSYEGMVDRLIEWRAIPKHRDRKKRRGLAEFDYIDLDTDLVWVAYYHKDYGFVTEKSYTKDKIREMYNEYKQKGSVKVEQAKKKKKKGK